MITAASSLSTWTLSGSARGLVGTGGVLQQPVQESCGDSVHIAGTPTAVTTSSLPVLDKKATSYFATLALALALGGGLSGCASMAPPRLEPNQTRHEQVQKEPTVLNSVGSGGKQVLEGFGEMGRGIGHAFRDGWHQVRDGWNNADKPAEKPAAKAPAPAPKAAKIKK